MNITDRPLQRTWNDLLRDLAPAGIPQPERSRMIGERFDQALGWLVALPAAERESYLARLTPGECSLLGSIASSRAASAVNRRSVDQLAEGILAASYLVDQEDSREIVRTLVLLANSAKRLDTTIKECVPQVRDKMTAAGVRFVDKCSWDNRLDLRAYGYTECWNSDIGFYYGSLWGSRTARRQSENDQIPPGFTVPEMPAA